jgi:hypothetical protein
MVRVPRHVGDKHVEVPDRGGPSGIVLHSFPRCWCSSPPPGLRDRLA